jgi:hypothetical protein
MKHSKTAVLGKATTALKLRFEAQALTSYSGLILFQHFFAQMGLKERFRGCFRHLKVSPIYGHHVLMMLLVVHLLLGHRRRLRDLEYYRDDEMVKRVLGLKRLPDVATLSRALASADERSVQKVREESTCIVLERLSGEKLARVTLDFDGSVQSTGRHAEGTAVGFNKKKKGERSYYPLFCTVAQTDQILDVHHRPGNVHDSNGAEDFIAQCVGRVREQLSAVTLETRIDSAFFNETITNMLDEAGVQFTISVPFERFAELKTMVEGRKRWRTIDERLSYFDMQWKPKSWNSRYRFLFIRKRVLRQNKAPIQLDLFVPREHDYEYKVIVTNKHIFPGSVVAFHEGRGSQEGIFAELKSGCQMDYVPVTTEVGNRLYRSAAILAHNLSRELQMRLSPRQRRSTPKRAALWRFRELATLRRTLIQRAGRILRPAGQLILSLDSNERLETELTGYIETLQNYAA